jgi:cardiolipin synthase
MPGDPEWLINRMLLRIRRMNRGNHRKFCLIDSRELWVGSFNVSDVHLKEVYGDKAWKDVGVCVRGRDLKYARRAFQRAYLGWRALNWPAKSPKLLLLNDSFLHKRHARLAQVTQIKKARRRIYLATPYFVPVGHILRILIRRARAGVDVRLIIPRKNDIWIMKWMSIPILKILANKGVKIFVYTPRFSHQKVFIADDWISIGSTNLNHRSFLHDLEMDVVLTHQKNKDLILNSFIADQAQSQPFDTTSWARLPFWKRVFSFAFSLVKYWS